MRIKRFDFAQLQPEEAAISYQKMLRELEKRTKHVTRSGVLHEIEMHRGQNAD